MAHVRSVKLKLLASSFLLLAEMHLATATSSFLLLVMHLVASSDALVKLFEGSTECNVFAVVWLISPAV